MIVADASVALSWLMDDERTVGADLLARALGGELLLVPGHWWAEIANALVIAVRRNRTDSTKALELLASLQRLQVQVSSASADFYGRVMLAAAQFSLSAYDAAYLVLAEQEDVSLATSDKKLRQAALHAGVILSF